MDRTMNVCSNGRKKALKSQASTKFDGTVDIKGTEMEDVDRQKQQIEEMVWQILHVRYCKANFNFANVSSSSISLVSLCEYVCVGGWVFPV